MRIFVGKISPSLTPTQVLEHFKTFGHVEDYVFKGSYAFVEVDDEIGIKILKSREHNIDGNFVIVDNSIPKKNDFSSQNRDSFSYKDRQTIDDSYYDRNRDIYPISNDIRKPSFKPYYDDNRYRNYDEPLDRINCSYCSKCSYHGSGYKVDNYIDRQDFDSKRNKRGHPNDVNKIVIQDFPFNVSICDLEDFVKSFGFDIVFSRLTARGDCAIIELKSIRDKEDAIEKLNGADFCGSRLFVREFKTFGPSNGLDRFVEKKEFTDKNDLHRSEEDDQNVDIYSGLDNINMEQ